MRLKECHIITVKPLIIRGSHKFPSTLTNFLPKEKYIQTRDIYQKIINGHPCFDISSLFCWSKNFSMPGGMGNSHRICEYIKYTPKLFSTWLYVATMLNPSPPPLSTSIFLHLFLYSITPYQVLIHGSKLAHITTAPWYNAKNCKIFSPPIVPPKLLLL